jgi:D-glycero-alpha-D-manno-heptose-7-phosphate kinase
MILSRTPLRVSFVGGGTDLPAFYRKCGGAVVTSALAHSIDVTVRPLPPGSKFSCRLEGGEVAEAASADEIGHRMTREALRLVGVEGPLEITSRSSVPCGTGLGSSSSFAVGLLNALHAFKGERVPAARLAEEACHLEIELLGEPIGKQDQYIASAGGVRHITFHPDESVVSSEVGCAPEVCEELERHLLLFYLGGRRPAGSILAHVNRDIEDKNAELRELKSLCDGFLEVLLSGTRLNRLGEILDEAWRLKRRLNDAVSNERIDGVYARARAGGAVGGKLLGAGGAGFLLLFVPPERQAAVRAELREFRELQYRCERLGSRIVFSG